MIFLGIDFSWLVITLKVLGSILSVASIVGIVISFFGILDTNKKKKEKRENYFVKQNNNDYISENDMRWIDIRNNFQSNDPTNWRMAIIDADSMLEDLITSIGYDATTFGDKLKMINRIDFPLIDSVWYVHKLRNNLAHQGSSYHLSERDAYQAFKIYEQIFYENNYIS